MKHRIFAASTIALMLALPPMASAQSASPAPASAGRLDTRLTAPAKTGGVIELDRIVAVVNNEVITQNDLNERMAVVVKQLQSQSTQ